MTPSGCVATAIALIAAIETDPARPADSVASGFFRARRYIGAADRRTVSSLVWRVLRSWRRLDWWLTRIGLDHAPHLRLAVHLLLDGWPLGRVLGTYSGGTYAPAPLTEAEQAALRRLAGHTLDHPHMDEATALEVPDWLLPALHERFGPALAAELAGTEAEAPLDLRVNLLKTTREQAQAALQAEGIVSTPTPHSPWGLRVEGRRPVVTGAAFRAGLVEIQDEGSQLLARLVDARPEMRVADYCAGAGGKTLALAMTMQNRGHIVACDVSAPRLAAAVQRLRRAGVHNAETHLLEAGGKWAKRRAGSFDRVLVDAPCTGTGTWRRNPDARLRLSETDLAELVAKQAAILQSASALVKPQGWLVYGTCSLLAAENEAQVAAFLARNPNFRAAFPPMVLTPRSHGTDGFFAAVLERAA